MSEHGHIKFWQEIGRRNVLRVAAVYVGFSWAVVHSGVVVGEALELPHWIMRFVSAVLIVGFPAVVAFAWVYEITPEGLKRAEEVERDKSITHRTAQRLNVVIIALIVLLAGLYGADRFLLKHEGAEGAAHVAAEGATKAPASEGGISIAVLPFLNLSSDKEQEFFSDGMTEEITSALAEVKSLKVVGRTSAFQFKGENKDLRAIGQALGAANLLEGSVRKAGDRVRITGQLIRAADGTHIWTASYDRDLKDVFAVQEEVAKAIAAALKLPLGLAEGEHLVADRATDTDSYQDYLRARSVYRARDIKQSITMLEKSVRADPNYAPAWALLAESYSLAQIYLVPRYDRPVDQVVEEMRSYIDKADRAARQALALNPRDATAHAAAAQVAISRRQWFAADDEYRQALALAPDDPDILNDYSGPSFLVPLGYLKQAVAVRDKLHTLEPLVPIYNALTARVLLANGQNKAALAAFQALSAERRGGAFYAIALANAGRFAEAADSLLASPPERDATPRASIEAAARLLRSTPAAKPSANDPPLDGNSAFVYAFLGTPSRTLEAYQRYFTTAGMQPALLEILWGSSFAPARKTDQFKAIMRNGGYVEFWRARGWPDLCHPVGADDFECS